MKVKPVRRSGRTIWKSPAIKNGPGKDMDNLIKVVDEEVAKATRSGKDGGEAGPRKLRDEGGSCLALLRSVENVNIFSANYVMCLPLTCILCFAKSNLCETTY